jgi:hypothetical protein
MAIQEIAKGNDFTTRWVLLYNGPPDRLRACHAQE